MKTLTLRLRGGLGNQLFQCFAGIEIAKLQNRNLVLDKSWYRGEFHRNGLLDSRKFELDEYEFLNRITVSESNLFFTSPGLERIIRSLPRKVALAVGNVHELSSKELSGRRSVSTFGHWIGTNYLPSRDRARELLVSELRVKSEDYLSALAEISRGNCVAIHVRGGDYHNFPEVYGVLTSKYFRSALDKIGAKGKGIWLFSDTPEHAKEVLGKNLPIEVDVSSELSLSSAQTLALMSCASTLIASNSTFSWWAAYANTKGAIVFPKKYTQNLDTLSSGLYVKNWDYL